MSLGVFVVLALGVAAVLTFGGSGDGTAGASATGLQRGPQGRVPQFVVRCAYSHGAADDPIVYPGEPGFSHHHDFFGNTTTDAFSTTESLVGQTTSCERAQDTAAYWAPTLYDGGVAVTPQGADAYYRPGPGVDPASVEPYPPGLVMISGDHLAESPQSTSFVGWACGAGTILAEDPPDCPADAPLRLKVVFPDCWDGEHLDSADHKAHMAPSVGGTCPDSHPVPVPQLTFVVRYPVHGEGHDLALASGSVYTAHADFMNAWDQDKLTEEVELCLHRELVCGVISNKADDADRPSPQANG